MLSNKVTVGNNVLQAMSCFSIDSTGYISLCLLDLFLRLFLCFFLLKNAFEVFVHACFGFRM